VSELVHYYSKTHKCSVNWSA